jgi:class 3 adenylate cyclase
VAEQGGEILKLIGDAMLAVFPVGEGGAVDPCRRALTAGVRALASVRQWREQSGLDVQIGIALHIGRVMYGNIGGRERLDFTVIGASVNEVCRVESLAKELGLARQYRRLFTPGYGLSMTRRTLHSVDTPAHFVASTDVMTLPLSSSVTKQRSATPSQLSSNTCAKCPLP